MHLVANALLFPFGKREVIPGCATLALPEVGIVLNSFPIPSSSDSQLLVSAVAPEEKKLFVELLFAVHFAIRQLSNVGDGPIAENIVDRLQDVKFSRRLYDRDGVLANMKNPQQQSKKKLSAELYLEGGQSQLIVKHSGFGFFGSSFQTDMPNAVLALFIALVDRHHGNVSFGRRVFLCCQRVAHLWTSNKVTLTNHAILAISATSSIWQLVTQEGDHNVAASDSFGT
jgi:hypothetical protein